MNMYVHIFFADRQHTGVVSADARLADLSIYLSIYLSICQSVYTYLCVCMCVCGVKFIRATHVNICK